VCRNGPKRSDLKLWPEPRVSGLRKGKKERENGQSTRAEEEYRKKHRKVNLGNGGTLISERDEGIIREKKICVGKRES